MTKLIYQNEGSYGSRLHRVDATVYIGYAQWPDRETWEKSGTQLPESAAEIRTQLRESCAEIKTEFEMEVVMDLLKSAPYKENHY